VLGYTAVSVTLALLEFAIKLPGTLLPWTSWVVINDFYLVSSTLIRGDVVFLNFELESFSPYCIFRFSIEKSRFSEGTCSLLPSSEYRLYLVMLGD
jgi:hypothetical protein